MVFNEHTRIHANFRSNVNLLKGGEGEKETHPHLYFNALLPFFDRKYLFYYCSHARTNALNISLFWLLIANIYQTEPYLYRIYFSMLTAQIWPHKPVCHLASEMSQHIKSIEQS